MAMYPILLFVLLFSLFATSSQSQNLNLNLNDDHHLISELQEAKIRITRLESVLEETIENLNLKVMETKEREKEIEDMENKIQSLKSAVSSIKGDSLRSDQRIHVLEEEVKLLWGASRKNNFDIHALESKARDLEETVETITAEVEKMSDIVTEDWIQIQRLEQMVEFNARRLVSPTRCTFLKFINDLSNMHLPKVLRLESYSLMKESTPKSYLSRAKQQLKGFWAAVTKYHHKLQSYVRQEMEKNELTAALANEEVVFFVASALITFPVLSAWLLLSS